jgi:tetratricopeptide (TPR) repeat protein
MDQWQEKLPKTRGGVMSIDLVLAARKQGFDARLITGDRGTVERELIDGHPVIMMLQVIQAPGKGYDFYHYIVLDGIDTQRQLLRTQFGDGKARWAKFEKLDKAWKTTSRAAILIRPRDPSTDILRTAVGLEEKGQDAAAADVYRDLLARHPESVVGWTNLGNVETRLGNRESATSAYQKALALDARSRDALNNLAWLLYEEKRFDDAELYARRAVEVPGPDTYMVLDTLARILAAKGSCEEATKRFREAIDAVPQSRAAERQEIEKTATSACKS